MHFLILPSRSRVFTVVDERSCFFPSFFFTIQSLANDQEKEKKTLFVRPYVYVHVGEDHILGYDKNIFRSFRQNVPGIERFNKNM